MVALNKCCFCLDLKIGGIAMAILQIFLSSVYLKEYVYPEIAEEYEEYEAKNQTKAGEVTIEKELDSGEYFAEMNRKIVMKVLQNYRFLCGLF